MAKVIYEMEAIGQGGNLEAVGVHWYCSEGCRVKAGLSDLHEYGDNEDFIEHTQCEVCGKEL